jgi:hypothetical protein
MTHVIWAVFAAACLVWGLIAGLALRPPTGVAERAPSNSGPLCGGDPLTVFVWRDAGGDRQWLVLEECEEVPGLGYVVRFDSTDPPDKPELPRRVVHSLDEARTAVRVLGGTVESHFTVLNVVRLDQLRQFGVPVKAD